MKKNNVINVETVYKERNPNLIEPKNFRSDKIVKDKNSYRVAIISPQVIGAKKQVRKATPPLGQAYIAGVLEAKGHEVLLIDAAVDGYSNVSPLDEYIANDKTGSFKISDIDHEFIIYGLSNDKIIDKVREFSPDVLGVSSLFSSQTECAYSIARSLKSVFPNLPIIMGGNHASQQSEEIMDSIDEIDFIITGECDFTFSEFVQKYLDGENYKNVPGLVWREEAQICKNDNAPFIRDLDVLPFPAWHLYDLEKYFEIGMPHNVFIKSDRVAGIMTSRGCPEFCYFCTTPDFLGGRFRAMSVEKVVELVEYNVENWGVEELQILDDTFTLNHSRVVKIMEGIKHLGLRISLPNAIRADAPIDVKKRLNMFKAMADAGVYQLGISVEHGDQDFLDNVIQKRLSLEQVKISVDLCHEAGILAHTNFMMGFPFETAEHREKTIRFARELDSDSYSVSLVAPLPGTPLWDICKEHKLFMPNFNVDRVVLANVNIKPYDITPEELLELVDKLNRELNEKAQNTTSLWRREKIADKYETFKQSNKSTSGDRKLHFSTQSS